MKLSDAILLGSTIVEPCDSTTYRQDGAGCALGMALESIGEREHVVDSCLNYRTVVKNWPFVKRELSIYPCECNAGSNPLFSSIKWAIIHLFDVHVTLKKDWSLERLADWVRSVEPEEATTAPEITAEVEEYQIT